MEENHSGVGFVQPLDAEEFIEITLREANGEITAADFRCSENEVLCRCGETLCAILPAHPVTDLFLINNNAVYYNIEPSLKRHELYFATMAVLAAKRAAAAWCIKNNVPVPVQENGCTCITNEFKEESR